MGREKTGRPVDTPIGSGIAVTGQDLEQRAIIFPPSFIDDIVLKGGDEYVKAEDLKTLISAIVDYLGPILKNIETHLSLGSDEELDEEGEK